MMETLQLEMAALTNAMLSSAGHAISTRNVATASALRYVEMDSILDTMLAMMATRRTVMAATATVTSKKAGLVAVELLQHQTPAAPSVEIRSC